MDRPTQFGFKARATQYAGEGDGDGLIQGCGQCSYQGGAWGVIESPGEPTMLWVDLSTAKLVDGGFTLADSSTYGASASGSALNQWFPQAKLGGGNYVYAYSPTWQWGTPMQSVNYFGVSVITSMTSTNNCIPNSNTGMTVKQAYSMDKKVDDGLPQSGKVIAMYLAMPNGATWTDGVNALMSQPNTGATPASGTTCYDNGSVAGQQKYSIAQNNGNGVNCALSFQFQ